jgi:Bacterial regulatory proteins, luxR family
MRAAPTAATRPGAVGAGEARLLGSSLILAPRPYLSRHTVRQYVKRIYRKLGVDSRVALTRLLLGPRQNRLIDDLIAIPNVGDSPTTPDPVSNERWPRGLGSNWWRGSRSGRPTRSETSAPRGTQNGDA